MSNISISSSESNENGMVFIKHLPKDKLLFDLWHSAKPVIYMSKCSSIAPILTLKQAREDINYMIQDNREVELTTYYGRLIFLDITGDYLSTYSYDIHNGKGVATAIIRNLKITELNRSILKYYTF
jgi:hypothetical protein